MWINLDDAELDTPIYRVFNFQRLVAMFAASKNTLVKPALWDDPLENYVLHVATKAFEDHPYNFDFTAKDRFYGQCWSIREESDAMWRIYSPDKSGVKVKTTIRKLLESLRASSERAGGECFVGKVKYLSDETLREKLRDRFWLQAEIQDSRSQAASLLFKRIEFEHEQEVRLLFLHHDSRYMDNLFHYSITPSALFDEVQFDPRISEEMYKVFKYYLEEKLNFTSPVTRSGLYQVPELQL